MEKGAELNMELEFERDHLYDHETVLDTKLLVPAFRRKVADLVEENGEMTGDAGHRPAKVYRERR